jgi:2-keto-4-pentenoate hydratase/2-oxohepta-3-ene-1,7-dioic acid hydratase in catechol pathway
MAKMSRRRFLEESAAAGLGVAAAGALPEAAALEQAGQGSPPAGGLRLCRYQRDGAVKAALFLDDAIVDMKELAANFFSNIPADSANLLDYLPPDGKWAKQTAEIAAAFFKQSAKDQAVIKTPLSKVKLLVPIGEPKKAILLAGNYADHIKEGGGVAAERQDTYPYFFWKPPSTTLTHPGDPIRIPKVSPDHVDWEIELGVVIGKTCRDVAEKDALNYVAGYSVCNDVSDRKFQINPMRKPRERDRFHDWLHGKWHDTFLPMGPCVRSSAGVDPQKFPLKLKVNGQVMQEASTGQMIFPVAALVSILSSFTTLEAGDVIVTGTPAGVGHARKPPVYLKKGDVVDAEIGGIGLLKNPVV